MAIPQYVGYTQILVNGNSKNYKIQRIYIMRHLLLFLFSAISFTSFGRELKGVVMNVEKATIPFANILIYT